MTDDVVAVLLEPIQGESGVRIPPPGYLAGVRELTSKHGVLFIADEIQSGLGRTGRTLACEHEGVIADVYLLGKALGGGIVPVSAVVADHDVLGVLQPGQHGSTFGGNPLACALGLAVVRLLETGEYQERATRLGVRMRERLDSMIGRGVISVRSGDCGQALTLIPGWERAATSVRRWRGDMCSPRTRTARPFAWRHHW